MALLSVKTMARKLDAQPGDSLTIYYGNRPLTLEVTAIARDSVLSGVLGSSAMGMTVPLARLQEITGQPGAISLIFVANAGGVRGGLAHSDAVTSELRKTLQGTQLGVDPIKQDLINAADQAGSTFTTIFMLFGLFSVAAGILLIVLIFAMLAAERRAEMGMERAIGTQRRQLIAQFVSEGMGYTLVAGLVGTGLGVLAALGITRAMAGLFGDDLSISAHIEPRSLIVAYSIGVVITFIAVVTASWWISKLNIVTAIRDLPESKPSRHRRVLLVWGGLFLVLGSLMAASGWTSHLAVSLYAGLSILPFGVALVLRYFSIPGRLVFSATGCFLLALWLMPGDLASQLFGELDQGMELFFVSGIFLVLGITLARYRKHKRPPGWRRTDGRGVSIAAFRGSHRPSPIRALPLVAPVSLSPCFA